MGYDNPKLDRANAHSMDNRTEIEASSVCGCFYCRRTFPPSAIEEWVDDGQTALCPKCGIDSVLGDKSGLPIRPKFLSEMHRYWFRIR